MSKTRTIHLDLGNMDANACYTFHRGIKTYPVYPHTPTSRADAVTQDARLAEVSPTRLTHYVSGVVTDPSDGVIIQAVKQQVSVAGPNGPNTQTFDQLVSYSIDIPGSDLPITGYEALAYALMFLHNNLLNLDASNDYFTPNFIFNQCIIPNAGDLITQLNPLNMQNESWISEPYPVKQVSGEYWVIDGEWVYSQRLNMACLSPALPD